MTATIDARCACNRCEERTRKTYEMQGKCYNCGAGPFTITFRAGDKAVAQDCPVCENFRSVNIVR